MKRLPNIEELRLKSTIKITGHKGDLMSITCNLWGGGSKPRYYNSFCGFVVDDTAAYWPKGLERTNREVCSITCSDQ